jgi:serine/threonine protein kinase
LRPFEEYLILHPNLIDDKDAAAQVANNEYQLLCDAGNSIPLTLFLKRFERWLGDPSVLNDYFALEAEGDSLVHQSTDPDAIHLRPETAPLPTEYSAKFDHLGYVLHKRIGRGGMGAVYFASHKRSGQKVAIKVMLGTAHATPTEKTKFLEEAQATRELHHPNIVKVVASGDADGEPFMVMEYCSEGSLAARLKDGRPWNANDAAKLTLKLARAIAFSHKQQVPVFHFDLKPNNILFCNGEPKIIDFGLGGLKKNGQQRDEGMITGTPYYRAPEQTGSGFGDVDQRTDIYGLGAILYHLLTGFCPFHGATEKESIELVQKTRATNPNRFRAFSEQDKVLCNICMKCLETEQQDRYPSADDLVNKLEAYINGKPTNANESIFPLMDLKRYFGPDDFRRWGWAVSILATNSIVAILCVLLKQRFAWWDTASTDLWSGEFWFQIAMLFGASVVGFVVFVFAYPSVKNDEVGVRRYLYGFLLVIACACLFADLVAIRLYFGSEHLIKSMNILYIALGGVLMTVTTILFCFSFMFAPSGNNPLTSTDKFLYRIIGRTPRQRLCLYFGIFLATFVAMMWWPEYAQLLLAVAWIIPVVIIGVRLLVRYNRHLRKPPSIPRG